MNMNLYFAENNGTVVHSAQRYTIIIALYKIQLSLVVNNMRTHNFCKLCHVHDFMKITAIETVSSLRTSFVQHSAYGNLYSISYYGFAHCAMCIVYISGDTRKQEILYIGFQICSIYFIFIIHIRVYENIVKCLLLSISSCIFLAFNIFPFSRRICADSI